MRILIACEFSGIVREAFTKLGHDATSCDLLPTEIPGKHYQGNVLDIINDGWDMMIAHPPCTYLTASANKWYVPKHNPKWQERLWEREMAKNFFMDLFGSNIPKIAIENPIGIMSSFFRKPDQIIQPWMFGHPESKATCLWLKGLPKLVETTNVKKDFLQLPKNQQQKLFYLPPSKDRWKLRSITFQGIADAMGNQWGNLQNS